VASATVPRIIPLAVLVAIAAGAANASDSSPFRMLRSDVEPQPAITAPVEFVRLLPGIPRPVSVAVAPDGRILVTDSTTPLAKAFLPRGGDVTLLPAPRGSEEPASAPFGIAVDESGDVYVSDPTRREVLVYRSGDLRPSPFAGPEWGERVPGALFARAGRLYAADIRNHQIVVIDIAREQRAAVIGTGQGSGPTELRYPNGVWVDHEGVVYVSDTNNDRIQRFNPDGSALSPWHGSFKNPRGLAGDSHGRIFVANTLAHEILLIDHTGEVVSRISRAGTLDLGFPTGLAVVGNRLFVTDRDAQGVFEWRFTDERRTP